MAFIKETLPQVTKQHGLKVDSRLSKINGRIVLKNKKGDIFSVDTQHGRFEKIDPKTGRHRGEVDFDMAPTKPADRSGKHDLNV